MLFLKIQYVLLLTSGSFQKFIHDSDEDDRDKDEELLTRKTKTQEEKVLKCFHMLHLSFGFNGVG